jgi:hypothetical protein
VTSLLLLAALSFAQAPSVPYSARVSVSGEELAVGAAPSKNAVAQLDCQASPVQSTVQFCSLKPAVATFAKCLGRSVAGVTLNLHFQGEIVNMAIELAGGASADAVIAQLTSLFGRAPTLSPWADKDHLYASHIWVDADGEVEITKTVKGPDDGKVRLYVSSFAGRAINPDDLPKKKTP